MTQLLLATPRKPCRLSQKLQPERMSIGPWSYVPPLRFPLRSSGTVLLALLISKASTEASSLCTYEERPPYGSRGALRGPVY